MSPASAVYHSVSSHIVALVSCRSQNQRRQSTPSSSYRHAKRVRGYSDDSVSTESTSRSSSSLDSDEDELDNQAAIPRTHSKEHFRSRGLYSSEEHVASSHDVRGMRAAQAVCPHCRGLFFVALAPDGLFCSLDCRASWGLQREMDQRTTRPRPSFSMRSTLSLGRADSDDSDDPACVDSDNDDDQDGETTTWV